MSDIPHLPYLPILFAFFWFLLMVSSWLFSRKFTFIGLISGRDGIAIRLTEIFWRSLLILLIGYLIDDATHLKPHNAYKMWEFYVTFFVFSFVLSTPGFLFYRLRR